MSFNIALLGCLIWALFKLKIIYEFEDYEFWNFFQGEFSKDTQLLDELGITLESVKELIKKKFTNIVFFNTITGYIKFLYKNKIPYEINRDYSYIVYSNIAGEIKITERNIVDKNEPFEIYKYTDGGYASMLHIS